MPWGAIAVPILGPTDPPLWHLRAPHRPSSTSVQTGLYRQNHGVLPGRVPTPQRATHESQGPPVVHHNVARPRPILNLTLIGRGSSPSARTLCSKCLAAPSSRPSWAPGMGGVGRLKSHISNFHFRAGCAPPTGEGSRQGPKPWRGAHQSAGFPPLHWCMGPLALLICNLPPPTPHPAQRGPLEWGVGKVPRTQS